MDHSKKRDLCKHIYRSLQSIVHICRSNMETSIETERGAPSLQNLFSLIACEAAAYGLQSQEIDSAVIVTTPICFPDIHGIEPLEATAVLLYTNIQEEEETADGRPGAISFTANLWSLEMLTEINRFRTTVCPNSRYSFVFWGV